MATTYTDVRAALETHLATYAALVPLIDVALENSGFTPVAGTPWLRPVLLPEKPQSAGPGSSAKNVQKGIFMIDVMQPTGGGTAAAQSRADALVSHFKRGTDLTAGSVTLTSEAAWPAQARVETLGTTDWFVMPVSVRFFAYTDSV